MTTPSIYHSRQHPSRHCRAAVVLWLVLIVIAVLSLSGYSYCQFTATQSETVQLFGRHAMVRSGTDSGIAYVRSILAMPPSARDQLGGIFDNPELMKDIVVQSNEDPRMQIAFSVVSPMTESPIAASPVAASPVAAAPVAAAPVAASSVAGNGARSQRWRYGVQNESAKLNINRVPSMATKDKDARSILMQLPNMTAEIADCILDWLDADDDPRLSGAEAEYYTTCNPPYTPRNGPVASIHELSRVRGVTRKLLYGDAESIGWANLLTVHSRERNLELDGPERIDINQPDMQQLYDQLTKVFNKQWAMFIVALRQNGPHDGDVTHESALTRELDLSRPGTYRLRHSLDLFECNVQVTLLDDSEPIVLLSPFANDAGLDFNLAELTSKLIFDTSPMIYGRVNIMQARREVLLMLPHIGEKQAEVIINLRANYESERLQRDTDGVWLLSQRIVSLAQMRDLVHHVTCGGDVFRAQVVGYAYDGTLESRAEFLMDVENDCCVLMHRDLNKSSFGFRARDGLFSSSN